MNIFLIILSIFLFFLLIVIGFLFVKVEKYYFEKTKMLEEMLETSLKDDEEAVRNLRELFRTFRSFINLSNIIVKKYDLLQYQDYVMFLTQLNNIRSLLEEIVVVDEQEMENFEQENP